MDLEKARDIGDKLHMAMFATSCQLAFGIYYDSYLTGGMPLVLMDGNIYFY